MKRSLLVIIGFIVVVSVSLAFTKHEPPYKNLKILPKDITKRQMDSVMDHFTVSLNVKCNFCHIRNRETKEWDYAADSNKHKLVARDMLQMTYDINDKYFEYTGSKRDLNTQLMVNCYTCHNGHKEPLTIPPFVPKNIGDSLKRN